MAINHIPNRTAGAQTRHHWHARHRHRTGCFEQSRGEVVELHRGLVQCLNGVRLARAALQSPQTQIQAAECRRVVSTVCIQHWHVYVRHKHLLSSTQSMTTPLTLPPLSCVSYLIRNGCTRCNRCASHIHFDVCGRDGIRYSIKRSLYNK